MFKKLGSVCLLCTVYSLSAQSVYARWAAISTSKPSAPLYTSDHQTSRKCEINFEESALISYRASEGT